MPEISPFTSVTDTQDIYANLEPAVGDIDVGNRYQVSLLPASQTETFTMQVRANSGSTSVELNAWQVIIDLSLGFFKKDWRKFF